MTVHDGSLEGDERVLDVVGDADCQDILRTTADGPRTVSELVDRCGIPASTAYRKVETLEEVGLLDRSVRIRPTGRDAREYALRTGHIVIDLTELDAEGSSSGVAVPVDETLSHEGEQDPWRAFPDGGSTATEEDAEAISEQKRLGSLFVDVTGTDTLTERQDEEGSTRYLETVDGSQQQTLARTITLMARDDGMAGVLDGAGYAPD